MRRAASRGLLILIGTCAIAWAIGVFDIYRREASIVDVARRAMSGEKFNDVQLSGVRNVFEEASPSARTHALALNGIALIRLLLAESELRAGNRSPADLAD